jgi:hypothetical protein
MTRRITPTYVLLNQITLAAASSSVTFSNIPQGYGDLVLVTSTAAGNTGSPGGNARNLLVRANGDSGNNYPRVIMSGDGGTARSTSDTQSWFALDWYGHTNLTFHIHQLQFLDYSATDKHKTVLNRVFSTNATEAIAHRWANTAAINSLSIFYDSNTLAAGSAFYLYGVHA